MNIERATDLSWYPVYRSEYASFLAEDGQRRQWTQPESRAALAGTQKEGGVFLVRMNGTLAGVYAMRRTCAHGLDGFAVQEKLLFTRARGRGMGAIVEQAVIRELSAQPDDIIMGTIEGRNIASQRTAHKVGRRTIAARLWLTPSGYPGMPAI